MIQLLTTPEGRFRLVAWAEGLSFLVLLGIAMPLKYLAGEPLAVRIVGMAHGLLFIWYVVLIIESFTSKVFDARRTALGLVAGLLPFGTFVFEARVRRRPS